MRKLLQLNLAKVLLIAAMVTGMNSWGQMTFTSGALTQTQNFDGLPSGSAGSVNTATIGHNWYRSDGSTQSQALTAVLYGGQTTGVSSLAHGVYNCGSSSSSTDRAIGAVASGSGAHRIGVELKNTTGSTIVSFAISGNVEKYRNGDDSTVERVIFEYSTNATSLNNGSWTALSSLDLVEPSNANTSLSPALDGNAAANKAAFSGSISALTIANNGSVWIRWRDANAAGTDALLALDDVSVTATLQAPSAPTVATNAASDITASGATLNGSANANGLGTINLNFEYGTTTGYGSTPASVSPATATGSSNTAFSGAISSLTPNTTYNFRAKAGSADGSNATFVTLANAPAAPLVDGATASSLNVTIDAVTQNGNPAATQYAIRENGGQYVQSGGSLGASAVWQTAAQWGTKTVTGLSANTSYSFQAKARNNAATQVETAFSSLAAGTTLANTAPTLSATTLASFGSVCLNQSVTNSFQLLGENLTAATVTVGPLAGFTFSTTSGGTYDPSLTLNADVQGTIITDVFVKFTPTAAQIYSGNIAVAGGGASAINVAATATGVNTTPTVTTTAVTVFTGTTATMGGNVTVQGCTAVTARGIVYGTSNNPAIGGNGVIQVPSGSGTGTFSESVSGLTGSTLYYVRAYATNEGGTVYGSSVSFTTQCTTPVNATSFNPTAGNTQVALSWANGSCSDEVIVVAKASSAVTATPSGDGTGYTANAAFGTSGTSITTGEFIVYKGSGTSVTVTGLTNGTTYHFKVFTRRGSSWSSGTATSAVPALVYCTPTITNGCGDFGDGVDGFVLNGISNIDSNCNGNPQSYINYPTTSFTTTLFRGLTYEAQVTNGNYSGNIAVWIDFNNDGTFSTTERFRNTSLVGAGETIVFSIPVPADATIGQHRVRVREGVNNDGNLLTLDPCANYGYGETEDYTITITDNIYPTVTTTAVPSPAATTASVGGNVTSDAGSAVTARGVVYSLTANPAINGTGVTRVDIGSGTGSFNITVTGLQDNKQYYVRAFAINGNGTSYGAQETFTTLSMPAPALHDATEVSYRSFLASWDAVTGAQSYKLDVSTSATFGSVILIPDLIISEYIEGSSNNRSIEIYNGTGAAVNLSAYSLKRQFNGSGNFIDEVTLSGTLANGDVHVVSNSAASTAVLAQTDQAISGNFPTFTGNDPVALYHNGVQIDVVGTVNSSADFGANVTLIRKPSIVAPSTTYNSNDWTQQTTDYFTDLGTHTYGGNTPIFVTGYNNLTVNGTSQQVTGLDHNTAYYFRVRAVGVNTTSPNSTVKNTTTLKENIWDGTMWTLGTPSATDKAIIEGNYTTDGQPALTVGQLVVNSGTFTIAEGDNVTVTNDVSMTNSTHIIAAGEEQTYGGEVGEKVIVGPKMVIEHNANLIQVNDVNNTGNAQVYKQSAPMFRLDYAMWSSPVAGETLIGFSPETLANRFYTYRSTTNTYTNSNTNNGDIAFEEGVGYLIRTANNMQDYVAPGAGQPEPTGVRWEGDFIGTLNNGNVDVAVTPAGTGGSTGFNAVGNPYPSPINVHAFYDGNTASIDPLSTLFFWRKKNGSETESYAKLTKLAYSANSDNGVWGDSSMGAFLGASNTWVINPGQGFIVQATGSTIHFNNTMRRAVNNNQQFRNAQDETTEASRLWLNLKGTQGEFSQAVIGYTDVTTLGADYGWDGRAFMSDKSVIYSYMGEEKLGIQARPSFDASDVVPMGVKVETAGTYTISLDHVDGVFAADQDIFLRDNVLGVTHDLKQGAYEFALEAGLIAGRFDVVYAEALGNENPVWNANSVIIYKEGSAIKINSGNEEITAVSVYDMRGRLLYSGSDINATETAVNGLQAEKQVLIVNVSTQKGEVSKKIVF